MQIFATRRQISSRPVLRELLNYIRRTRVVSLYNKRRRTPPTSRPKEVNCPTPTHQLNVRKLKNFGTVACGMNETNTAVGGKFLSPHKYHVVINCVSCRSWGLRVTFLKTPKRKYSVHISEYRECKCLSFMHGIVWYLRLKVLL